MMLMCAHCNRPYPRAEYVIKTTDGKLYGGGALYKAAHKRCHRVTYLPAQLVRTVREAGVY